MPNRRVCSTFESYVCNLNFSDSYVFKLQKDRGEINFNNTFYFIQLLSSQYDIYTERLLDGLHSFFFIQSPQNLVCVLPLSTRRVRPATFHVAGGCRTEWHRAEG